MFIFLDESGDLGFDFDKPGTSRHFVVTLLVCDDAKTQKDIGVAVKRTIKNKINRKKTNAQTYELKGSCTDLSIKQYFYRNLPESGWKIYCLVLDKKRIGFHLRNQTGRKQLYNHLARELVSRVAFPDHAELIALVMDKCKSKAEIREFDEYLSNHLAGLIPLRSRLNITHEDSHKNPCLQAVDMFCWGIYKRENGNREWFDVYREKVVGDTSFSVLRRDGL